MLIHCETENANALFLELWHGIFKGANLTANHMKYIYVEGLRVLHSAERQLKDALPQMARAASNDGLLTWLTRRLEQANNNVARLEKVCAAIQESPRGEKCTHMEHLLATGVRMIGKHGAGERLDRELIAIAEGIEGQELAGLGWVCFHAKLLKDNATSLVLEKMLEEEKVAASKLAQLSDGLAAWAGRDGSWGTQGETANMSAK